MIVRPPENRLELLAAQQRWDELCNALAESDQFWQVVQSVHSNSPWQHRTTPEELASDVFTSILENKIQFDLKKGNSFLALARRVVHRTCYQKNRGFIRQKEVCLEDHQTAMPAEDNGDVALETILQIIDEHFEGANRKILQLLVSGYKAKELFDLLDVSSSLSTWYRRVNKLLAQLKSKME